MRWFPRSPRSLRRMRGHVPDLGLVLGLWIVGMVVVFVSYSKIASSARANQTREQLTAVANRLDAAPTNAWTTAAAQQAGWFNAWSGKNHAVDVWGGTMALQNHPVAHTAEITLGNVPFAECVRLMSRPPELWALQSVNGQTLSNAIAKTTCSNRPTNDLMFVHRTS